MQAEDRITNLVRRGYDMHRTQSPASSRRAVTRSPPATQRRTPGRTTSPATRVMRQVVRSPPPEDDVPSSAYRTAPSTGVTATSRPATTADTASNRSESTLHVPESLALRMYRQEQSDRMYVERLFMLREEHHCRQQLLMEESHITARIAAAAGYEWRLILLRMQQDQELGAMRAQLEDETNVGALRRELHDAKERVEAERRAVADLRQQLERRDRDRRDALEQERGSWGDEKSSLLRRMDQLERQVATVRTGHRIPSHSPESSPARYGQNVTAATRHEDPTPVSADVIDPERARAFDERVRRRIEDDERERDRRHEALFKQPAPTPTSRPPLQTQPSPMSEPPAPPAGSPPAASPDSARSATPLSSRQTPQPQAAPTTERVDTRHSATRRVTMNVVEATISRTNMALARASALLANKP